MTMNRPKRLAPRSAPGTDKTHRELSQYVAVIVFIGLGALLFASMRYGIQNDDETDCIAGAHRIMFGELPLLENWTIIQLHAFLQYLPTRTLYALLGGTEGIVLAFRYLYAAIKLLFFAAICTVFRRYRYWAILAAVVFTAFHPIGFVTLSYYNVSIMCAFALGLILFIKKKHSAADLLLAGVLLAFCVLAEPLEILLYLVFTLCVPAFYFIRKKRKTVFSGWHVLPDVKSWGLITAGAALVAGAVLTVLLLRADLKTILVNAPGVLRFLRYHPQTSQWEKYAAYFEKTGYAANAAAVLLLVATVALAAKKRMDRLRLPLFSAACLIFVWLTLELYLRNGFVLSALYLIDFKPIPLCFLGLTSYLLTREKNKRLFAFLLFGLSFSLCIDLLSRISVGTGAVVAAPVCVFLFRQALLESMAQIRKGKTAVLAKEKKGRLFRISRLAPLPLLATLLVFIVTEAVYCVHPMVFPTPEGMLGEPLASYIDRGPLKGLRTIPMLKNYYEAVLNDMDRMKSYEPRSLFVMQFCEWCNLYLDLPYATFSPDTYETEASRDCLLYFWSLHPDKKPDCVYIPTFGCNSYDEDWQAAEEKLSFMRSLCECEVQTGEAGYLLKVLRWK